MADVFIGTQEYFPTVGKVVYEGPTTDNPFAFRTYDAERLVGGRTMRDHLKFSVAYWHTFCGTGSDPFGDATLCRPWNAHADPMERARCRCDAAFEFLTKIGAPYYCFHDRDLAPEGATPAASEQNLQTMVGVAKERQAATGVRLLWGTANLFSHPRYMNGAATNPDVRAVAHAAHQVKAALDATVALDGSGYTFWGGREGYLSLWNTDMQREREHLARFLAMARDYGRKAGFQGAFFLEPKPMEPSKHQYDFDAATVIGFLREFGLDADFLLNIEANHATLAGHDFAHDLRVAREAGLLGSVDANRGDPRTGWDTDEFPTDVYETTRAMLEILAQDGLEHGGLNFDAKVRRNSTHVEDLFHAHIAGMDAFALGLLVAHRILEGGRLDDLLRRRYASFDAGPGAAFESGALSLEDLALLALEGDVEASSGGQEHLEGLVNGTLFGPDARHG